jgi:hypothetical protein
VGTKGKWGGSVNGLSKEFTSSDATVLIQLPQVRRQYGVYFPLEQKSIGTPNPKCSKRPRPVPHRVVAPRCRRTRELSSEARAPGSSCSQGVRVLHRHRRQDLQGRASAGCAADARGRWRCRRTARDQAADKALAWLPFDEACYQDAPYRIAGADTMQKWCNQMIDPAMPGLQLLLEKELHGQTIRCDWMFWLASHMHPSRTVLPEFFASVPEAKCLLFVRSGHGKVLGYHFCDGESRRGRQGHYKTLPFYGFIVILHKYTPILHKYTSEWLGETGRGVMTLRPSSRRVL